VQPIGILGGTFDPIHYGHLRPADQVRRVVHLGEVRLVPANQPPHRAAPQVSAAHRLRMAELAVAEFPGFVVDGRELKRPGPSYTVDTLRSLRAEFGAQPLCLLLGADAFRDLETWHEWPELPELAHLLVMQRPGYAMKAWPAWAQARRHDDPGALTTRPAGFVHFVGVTPVDVSATRVRERLRRGESIADDVPAPVIDYIRTHHLYAV